MDVVMKAVNFILLRGLNHHQFCELLLQAENQYWDLLLNFCNVRWLSQGDMPQRVHKLQEEIATFKESQNINAAEFRHQEWVSNLAFLVDLTSYLNNFSLQLKGKLHLIHEIWRYVCTFEKKLTLGKSTRICKLCSLCYTSWEQTYEQYFICFCDTTFKNWIFVSIWWHLFAQKRYQIVQHSIWCTGACNTREVSTGSRWAGMQ